MEITIEYNKPSEVFINGYKAYFYSNYGKGIITNTVLILISILFVSINLLPLLGYILFSFGGIYLFIIWMLYYQMPINTLKRRKNRDLKITINPEEICTYSNIAESKLKWKAITNVKIVSNYIVIISKGNGFIVLPKDNLSKDEYDWLLNFIRVLGLT
jgi:nitrate reductase NapE component